ncbi:MAG: hypothetical protein P8Q17_06220 [Methylophilaceae bacterium]|nr:hypothetical protein [Methylophilaceae bacterium]
MDFFSGIFTKNWHDKLIRQAKKFAAAEGKHGRPAPSSTSPDSHEISFLTEGESLILRANSKVTEFIKKTSPVVEETKSKLEDIEGEARKRMDLDALANKLHSIKNDNRTTLTNSHFKVIEIEGYLNSFKATHDVKNSPDYPDDVIHFLSIVFIVLVFEGVLNAYFWKNESGLKGGFLFALGFASVNIGFAMLIGMLVRYIHYNKSWALILSVCSLIFGVVGIILLNVWIATVRSMHHLNKITTPDLGSVLNDFSSVLLFFVGLIFALLAAYKGYYLFGSMPGYQKVTKDYEKVSQETHLKEKKLKEDIDSAISSEKNKITKILRDLTEATKMLSRTRADIRSSRENFSASAAEVFESTKLIIKTYREINSKSRPSNIPTPVYFNDEINLNYEIISTFHELENSAIEVSERSDQILQNITVSLNEDLSALDAFKANELGPVVEKYIREIKNDANRRFIDSIATFQKT